MSATMTVRVLDEETLRWVERSVELEVGSGVSMHIGADAYPGTVRKVSPSGKTIWVSRDRFHGTPGANSMEQSRKVGVYVPQHETQPALWGKYTLRKGGVFKESRGCHYLSAGRKYWQDPSF